LSENGIDIKVAAYMAETNLEGPSTVTGKKKLQNISSIEDAPSEVGDSLFEYGCRYK
jgi:hypothetical protein